MLALVSALAGTLGGSDRARAGDSVTQPPQPESGPGGGDYTHRGVRVSSGGTGPDAW
jgi:hypothetical protein